MTTIDQPATVTDPAVSAYAATAPQAGWYPDPSDSARSRWWDGMMWTDHTTATAPVGIAPRGVSRRARLSLPKRVLLALVAVLVLIVASPLIAVAALVTLITAIVALVKNTPTWLRLRSRGVAVAVVAISVVVLMFSTTVSQLIYPVRSAGISSSDTVPAQSTGVAGSDSASPVLDDTLPVASFQGQTSTAVDAASTTGVTALAVLATLEVKGRAPMTGYDRDLFGQRWLDVDRNGCDTRNDTLARDLSGIVRSGPCKVMSGQLADPYTGTSIDFVRGEATSELVQIDHVVSLGDAWQKGAQQLSPDQRATFANDPVNLLAVDGRANAQKSDGDAATWLPANKAFRCEFVATQISVKATYALWVTQAEHDAMARVLSTCPDQPAVTSTYAPQPAPEPTPPPAVVTEPVVPVAPAEPVAPAPAEPVAPAYYQNCDAVRVAGAAPLHIGQPGYSGKLDRDGDGVACE